MQVKQHILVHLYFLLKQEIVYNLYDLNFLGMDLKLLSIKYSLTSLGFLWFQILLFSLLFVLYYYEDFYYLCIHMSYQFI